MRPPRSATAASGRLAVMLAACMLLGACSNMSGPKSAQVREWAAGAGFSGDDQVLETDLSGLATGTREHDLLAVRTLCEAFGTDAETLYGELPTPDTTLTNELSNATQTFYAAALSCYSASSFASKDFRTFEAELASGTASYDAAKARLSALEKAR